MDRKHWLSALVVWGIAGLSLTAALRGAPPEPILHIDFDRWQGDRILDRAHQQRAITVASKSGDQSATALQGKGILGKALKLSDKKPAHASVDRRHLPKVADAFTIAAWVHPTSGKRLRVVDSLAGSGDADKGFSLFLDWSYEIAFELDDGPNELVLRTPEMAIDPRHWSHIAAVYDGQRARIFINGVEIASKAVPENFDFDMTLPRFTIGTLHWRFKQPFDGRIDEVKLYRRALSGAELVASATEGWSRSQ